jgi:chromosome segregation ATPase
MQIFDWLKGFFRRNPTLKVGDLAPLREHFDTLREEFHRLQSDVAALNTESVYLRSLVEAEELKDSLPEDEDALRKRYWARRKAARSPEGLAAAREEFKREFKALRRRRAAAEQQAEELREVVADLPERIDPGELLGE